MLREVPPGWVPPAAGTWTVDAVSFDRAAKAEKGLPGEALDALKRELRPIYSEKARTKPGSPRHFVVLEGGGMVYQTV